MSPQDTARRANALAITLNSHGWDYLDIEQVESALACFHQALSLAERFNLKNRKHAALVNLANAYGMRSSMFDTLEAEGKSDLDSAGTYYTRCLDFVRTTNDTTEIASLLIDIGSFYHQGMFNLARAESLFTQAIELSRRFGHQGDVGRGLYCRGLLHFDNLELAAARHDFADALPILQVGPEPYFTSWCNHYLKLMDTLIAKRKKLPMSEWKWIVANRREEIRDAMNCMRKLKVTEPARVGGDR